MAKRPKMGRPQKGKKPEVERNGVKRSTIAEKGELGKKRQNIIWSKRATESWVAPMTPSATSGLIRHKSGGPVANYSCALARVSERSIKRLGPRQRARDGKGAGEGELRRARPAPGGSVESVGSIVSLKFRGSSLCVSRSA